MWALMIEARELTWTGGANWRWPGELPEGGELPDQVRWVGGLLPSYARIIMWLDAVVGVRDAWTRQIRKWTPKELHHAESWTDHRLAKRLDQGEQGPRAVEAAPVIAALHQIEAAIHTWKGLALTRSRSFGRCLMVNASPANGRSSVRLRPRAASRRAWRRRLLASLGPRRRAVPWRWTRHTVEGPSPRLRPGDAGVGDPVPPPH